MAILKGKDKMAPKTSQEPWHDVDASVAFDDGRKRCGTPDPRKGLAILPVVPTVVPNHCRKHPELSKLNGLFESDDKGMQYHWEVLRTLPEGYLYVLKPNHMWDVYRIDTKGLLWRTMVEDVEIEQATPARPLTQDERAGAQFIVIDPKKHSLIWLAFSHYPWTKSVRSRYVEDIELRRQRMTTLDLMAAAAGSVGSGHRAKNAVKNARHVTEALGDYVADYASDRVRKILDEPLDHDLAPRSGQAGSLALTMARVSRATQGKKGIFVVLRDLLGLAVELNAQRNEKNGVVAKYVLERNRATFVSDAIAGIEKSFRDNNEWEEWTDRYQKHLDYGRYQRERKNYYDRVAAYNKEIDYISDDLVTLTSNKDFKSWWSDFDAKDESSALAREEATAACLMGPIRTKKQFEYWEKLLREEPTEPDSMIWGAVTALNPDLANYLLGAQLPDTGKIDKAHALVDLLNKAKGLRSSLVSRRSTQALGVLANALAGQGSRIGSSDAAFSRVVGRRVLILITARTTYDISPIELRLTRVEAIRLMSEARFGPPNAHLKMLSHVSSPKTKRVFIAGASYGTIVQETVAVDSAELIEFWLPASAAKTSSNPFKAVLDSMKGLDGALTWIGLVLQTLNLTNSLKVLGSEKASDKDRRDALFALTSSALGILGITAELVGAAWKASQAAAISRIGRMLYKSGGILGLITSIIDGIGLFVEASKRASDGDYDAAVWYSGAAICVIGAGVAGYVLTAGLVSSTVPVVGWVIAGVCFIVGGAICLWRAIVDTDNDLEKWLTACHYGVDPQYKNFKDELEALNSVMFAMKVSVEWDDNWGPEGLIFSANLPGLKSMSAIYYRVVIKSPTRKIEVVKTTEYASILEDRSMNKGEPYPLLNSGLYKWVKSPRIERSDKGVPSFLGELAVDDQFNEGLVEIQFYPDHLQDPTFVLPLDPKDYVSIVRD